MNPRILDPLYVAATIAQHELSRLKALGFPIDDAVLARLEAARKKYTGKDGDAAPPDLSLFEAALEDLEIDL